MMKRISLLLMILVICLSFVACRGKVKVEEPLASPVIETVTDEKVKSKEQSPESDKETITENSDAKENVSVNDNKENEVESEPQPPVETLAPSSNKEVVTKEDAPKVFWAMDTAYHVEGCNELKEKQYSEITWEMVESIMLRQCPVCNPPQYENYIENNE